MDESYYPPQPVTDKEVAAEEMQQQRIQNVLAQLSPDALLKDIHYRLKGYIKNEYGVWEALNEEETINPVLVSRYISYLSSILNQNTTMANYSQQEIGRIMNLVIEWVTDDLDTNAELYGLENDYTERTRIGHIIWNTTWSALKRALNGSESRRIFNVLKIGESLNPNMDNQQKSVWDNLKFWK